MRNTPKKLLALVLALAMALQWVPALADGEPTVTVDGKKVIITAGDVENVQVITSTTENYKPGDIMIDWEGHVWEWHEDEDNWGWVLLTDGEGNPVSSEGYTASEPTYGHSEYVTIDHTWINLMDSETEEYVSSPAESITATVGEVDLTGESNQTGVEVTANSMHIDEDIEVTANADSVTVTVEGGGEEAWTKAANANGISAFAYESGDGEASAAVSVAEDVTVSAESDESYANAKGILAQASGSDDQAAISVTVGGSVSAEAVSGSENDSSTAHGIEDNSQNGTVEIKAGDLSSSAESHVSASAMGIDIQNYNANSPGADHTITVGNVEATAQSTPGGAEGTYSYSGAYGVSATDETGNFTIDAGNVTVSAENSRGYANATGVISGASNGEGSVSVGDVNVSVSSAADSASATGVFAYTETGSTEVEAGRVTVSASGSNNSQASGVNAEARKGGTATVETGDVEATAASGSATGVSSSARNGEVTVETGSVTAKGDQGATGVSSSAGSQDNWREDENGNWTYDAIPGKSTVTVTGDVTATTTESGATGVRLSSPPDTHSENTVTVTGGVSAESELGGATGVNAYGTSQTTTTVTVGGDVNADAAFTAQGAYISNGGELTMTVGGDINANGDQEGTGLRVESFNNSETTVTVGNVTVTAIDDVEGSESTTRAIGVGDYAYAGTSSVETGDVTVTSEGHSTPRYTWEYDEETGEYNAIPVGTSHSQATGVEFYVDNDVKDASLTTGDVTVMGEAKESQFEVKPDSTRITATGVYAYTSAFNGSAEISLDDVTVEASTDDSKTGSANAYGIDATANGGELSLEAGDVSASAEGGFSTYTTGAELVGRSFGTYEYDPETDEETFVFYQGSLTAELGDVTAESENGAAYGVSVYGNGGTADVETGSVTADGKHSATGVLMSVSDSTRTVDGEVTDRADGSASVTVNGDVTATSDDTATGVSIINSSTESSVTVLGDVTANGETGNGIFVQNNGGEVNIVVDGTVSGSTDSIVLVGSQSVNGNKPAEFDNAGTSLTVWAAEENKDGHVATVVDRNIIPGNENNPAPTITDTVNEEATKAVEAAINYIVKIGTDFLKQITASGEKGKTVTVGGATYATANEGEDVNVSVKLDEDKEVLEGVYYNEDDETSLTKAEDLKKDSEGGFLMKMLRGGAMLLGLKIHTHSYDTYVYNNDATCTADGTETAVCSCGKKGETRAKAGTALGHSFGAYASDGNATCTADGTKTAKCVRCDVTDTVADEGSALGHSFGEYTSNGDATCTADGTKTAKCVRCDVTDNVADEGSALGHSFANYVSDGNATCVKDGTKTAKCVRCDVTDTVADTNSKTGHTPGDAVQENYYAAGPGYSGSYDLVVYCDVCGQEISRNTIFIPDEPVEEPAAPAPKTHLELVYEPVDDTAEQNGVVIAEHPEMEETFQIVLETLQQDEEITKITIPAMEEALTEEQAQVFDSLTIQEQLTLTLCALGYSENQDTLSDSGAQLLAEISGNQEVLDAILAQFPVEEETIDGEVREVIKIEILIEKDGVASFQRYYFFKSEGVWKLFKIENGVYVEVRD